MIDICKVLGSKDHLVCHSKIIVNHLNEMFKILMLYKFLLWDHRLMRGLIYYQDELECNEAYLLNFHGRFYNLMVVILKLNSHFMGIDFVIPNFFNIFISQKSWLFNFFNKLKFA